MLVAVQQQQQQQLKTATIRAALRWEEAVAATHHSSSKDDKSASATMQHFVSSQPLDSNHGLVRRTDLFARSGSGSGSVGPCLGISPAYCILTSL